MKLELPSGNWIELRGPEQLNAGDRTAMHAAVTLPMDASRLESGSVGMMNVSLGMVEAQNYAVLARVIFAWSYPMCLPREDASEGYEDSLKQIPLDDWDVIEEAVAGHMAKLRGSGPKGKKTATASSNGTSKAKDPSPRD